MEKSVLSFCAIFSAFPMSFSCTAVFLINPKEENMLLILTESSKSPASIAKSNKQWVGTCLYQEWYKPLLISCEAAIRL